MAELGSKLMIPTLQALLALYVLWYSGGSTGYVYLWVEWVAFVWYESNNGLLSNPEMKRYSSIVSVYAIGASSYPGSPG